jgi:hypothetical protein
MRSRRLILTSGLLIVILSLLAVAGAGCVPKGGTAERPAVIKAWVHIIDPSREGPSVNREISGSETMFVSTGPLDFCVELGVVPAPDWFARNVTVTGATPSQSGLRDRQVSCSFPPGPAGEKITVTIAAVRPQDKKGDTMVVVMERADPPMARLELERDGNWVALESGDVVAAGPLRLRLGFTQPMDRAAVGKALTEKGLASFTEWTSDQSATITLAQPPSLIEISLWAVPDARGLPLKNRAIWEIYVGEEPQLYCLQPGLQPGTFQEKSLGKLMADVCAAAVSPDGRTLLVEAFKNRTGLIGVWLVDLATGNRQTLEGAYYPAWIGASSLLRFEWTGDSIGYEVVTTKGVVLHEGPMPRDLDHYSLSPNGRYLAGLVAKPAGADGYLVWSDLAVIDLETGSTRLFENFVRIYTPPDAPMILGAPAWSKDCSRIAGVCDQVSGGYIRVLDLAQGLVVSEVPLADLQNGSWRFFSWSPDDRWWIAGESIIRTDPSIAVDDLVIAGLGRPLWNGKGDRFARSEASDGWGQIGLFRIDAAAGPVAEQPVGIAFPAGWDQAGKFYFIRWPGAADRFVPVW